jgi:hypothetical protein
MQIEIKSERPFPSRKNGKAKLSATESFCPLTDRACWGFGTGPSRRWIETKPQVEISNLIPFAPWRLKLPAQ